MSSTSTSTSTSDLDAAIAAQGQQFKAQLTKGILLLSHKPAKLFPPRTRPVKIYTSQDLHYLYLAKPGSRKGQSQSQSQSQSHHHSNSQYHEPSNEVCSPTPASPAALIAPIPSHHSSSSNVLEALASSPSRPQGPAGASAAGSSVPSSPSITSMSSSSSSASAIPPLAKSMSASSAPSSLLAVRGQAPLLIDGQANTPSPAHSSSPAPPSPSVLSIPQSVLSIPSSGGNTGRSAPPSPKISSASAPSSSVPSLDVSRTSSPPPELQSFASNDNHKDYAKRIPTSQLMTVLSGVYGMRKEEYKKCEGLIPDQCLTLIFRKRTMWLQAESVTEKDDWLRACGWLKERVEERETQAAEKHPSERAKRNAALSSIPLNMTPAKKSAFLLRTGHYFTRWDSRNHAVPIPLYINCSSDLSMVKWGHNPTQHPDKKHASKLQAPATSILDVTFGLNCPIFQVARFCFSIYFAGDKKLHLEVDSQQERDEWVEAFRWLKTSMSKISRVLNVEHVTHLDRDMKWTGDSMERNFQLGGKIGQGGFCEVYRTEHAVTGFEMAVKIYKNVDMNDFKNETKVLKQAHHPNLVGYYGCWGPDSQGRTWVLMDYCDGGSISSIIRKYRKHAEALNPNLLHRPAHIPLVTPEGEFIHNPHNFSASTCYMSEQLIAYVLQATIRALMYLHQLGIVHRDVKGGNILLTKKGEVKLSDFGIAAHLPPEALADDGKLKEQKREVGKIAGSPHFMAPEALRGYPVHKLHDIWSVGITALELSYYGKPPYHDLPYHKVALQVCRNPAPKLEGDWSPQYKDFVSKCLMKDIKDRWDGAALLEHPFITSIDHAKCQLELQQFLLAGPPLPGTAPATNVPVVSPIGRPVSPAPARVGASPQQANRGLQQPQASRPIIHPSPQRAPSPSPQQRAPSPAPIRAPSPAPAPVPVPASQQTPQQGVRAPVLQRPPSSPETSATPQQAVRPILVSSISTPAATSTPQAEPLVSTSNRAVRQVPTSTTTPSQSTQATQATQPTSSNGSQKTGTPAQGPSHSPTSGVKKLSVNLPTSKPVAIVSPTTSRPPKKSIVGAMVVNGQLLDDMIPQPTHRPRSHSLGSVSTKSNIPVVLETQGRIKRVNSESRLDVKAKEGVTDDPEDDEDSESDDTTRTDDTSGSTQVAIPRVHDGEPSDSDDEDGGAVEIISPHVVRSSSRKPSENKPEHSVG